MPGEFHFADRSGVTFEWNDSIDKHCKGLHKEDMVLFPTLAAELPGVTLDHDLPVTAVEDEIPPQGRAKDAAVANAGLVPLDPRAMVHEACFQVQYHHRRRRGRHGI